MSSARGHLVPDQIGPCPACAAKDAEIARLDERATNAAGVANRLLQERDALVGRLLDAALPKLAAPPGPGPEYPPMDEAIELFLDAKFTHGTGRWKQQRREAEKLVAAGKDADFVIETLSHGQQIDF